MVPNGTQVVSNGLLTSTSSQAGWTRFNWRENKPQASYLTTLVIGKYDITQDTTPRGLPVYNAYSQDLGDNAAAARASVERTGELVDWLSGYFGAYPFSSIGGVVPNTQSYGGLETQTRVTYGSGIFDDGSNTSIVVHELAHQWYGDSVSLSRWSDIWLNEGFAEYAQFLWSEHENEGTAQELADYAYARYPADHVFWTIKPGDPGVDHLFSWPVYLRGAMAIQALRNTVGDRTFFRILKGWPTERRYGNATVQDFRAYAERVSGRQLGDVFTTWLFTTGKPAVGPVPNAAAAAALAPTAERGAGQLPAEPKSWKKIEETANSVHAGPR